MKLQKGAVIEVTIDAFAYKGKGIVFLEDRFPLFIPRALPGQRVEVRVLKKKKRYAEGKLLKVLEPAKNQRTPLCPHTKTCGGCTFQVLPYSNQQTLKTGFVKDSFRGFEKRFGEIPLQELISSQSEVGYRNKMEYSFGTDCYVAQDDFEIHGHMEAPGSGLYLGLHAPGSFSKVVHVDKCVLQEDFVNTVRNTIFSFAKESGLPAYNPRSHEGVWRHVIVRLGQNTKQVQITLCAKNLENAQMLLAPLFAELSQLCRDAGWELVSGIYANNKQLSDTSYADELEIIHGKDYFEEKLGEITYAIGPYSFFQVNTPMAERLYTEVKNELQDEDVVLDLYCGTGSIGMFVHEKAKEIIGVEIHPESVENAKQTAKAHNLGNVSFLCGAAEKVVFEGNFPLERVSTIIVDPPRAGMHEKVVEFLVSTNVPKIVYVSCNPTTLARDAELLVEKGYSLKKITPVDLFPQTYHVESVAVFQKA